MLANSPILTPVLYKAIVVIVFFLILRKTYRVKELGFFLKLAIAIVYKRATLESLKSPTLFPTTLLRPLSC